VNEKKQKDFIHLLCHRRASLAPPAGTVAPPPIGHSFFASFCSQKEDSPFP
jgi:hypothetical protein